MKLLDRIAGWQQLLSFEVSLGDNNDLAARVERVHPKLEDVELVRFWVFAEARLLYEIWLLNPPQAFRALNYMSRIVERPFGTTVDCLQRASLQLHHYVAQMNKSVEQISGEYLGRRDAERKIHFLTPPGFAGNHPHPLAMIAGVVLFQRVLDTVKYAPGAQLDLIATARTFVRHFARGEWTGKRSMEGLPEAVFTKETRFH